jgi:ParB family chromosome partitioning protein
VDAFRCKVWDLHDRLEEQITEQTCAEVIRSFQDHGQLVPALGRQTRGNPDVDVELIYGARRLFVARLINQPLLVELRDLSDREAIVAMDMENRQRHDISPYERGLSYARWLRAGYFASQDDLARALRVSASQVSRLLKLALLPSVIVDAFGNALEICEGWGVELAGVLQDDERRRRAIVAARALGKMTPRPPGHDVFRELLASAAPGRRPKATTHDKVVKAHDGAALFRIRQQRKSVAVIISLDRITATVMDAIECSITRILDPVNANASDGVDARSRSMKRRVLASTRKRLEARSGSES